MLDKLKGKRTYLSALALALTSLAALLGGEITLVQFLVQLSEAGAVAGIRAAL